MLHPSIRKLLSLAALTTVVAALLLTLSLPAAWSAPPADHYPQWVSGTFYPAGALVTHMGNHYRCRQAHTSIQGYSDPHVAPALWELLPTPTPSGTPTKTYTPGGPTVTPTRTPTKTRTSTVTATATTEGIPAWAPWTTYAVGAWVRYNGFLYQCLQGHTSQPGWEPPRAPALWRPGA